MRASISLCVVLMAAAQAQLLVVQRQFDVEPVEQVIPSRKDLDIDIGSFMEDAVADLKDMSDQVDRDIASMEKQMDKQMSTAFRGLARDEQEPAEAQLELPVSHIEIQIQRPESPPAFGFPSMFGSILRTMAMLKNQQGALAPDAVPMETVSTDAATIEDNAADIENKLAEANEGDHDEELPEADEIDLEETSKTVGADDDVEETEPDTEDDDDESEDEKPAPMLAAKAEAPHATSTDDHKGKIIVFVMSAVGAFIIVIGVALVVIKKQFSPRSTPFAAAIDKDPILPGGADPEIASLMENRPYSPPSL